MLLIKKHMCSIWKFGINHDSVIVIKWLWQIIECQFFDKPKSSITLHFFPETGIDGKKPVLKEEASKGSFSLVTCKWQYEAITCNEWFFIHISAQCAKGFWGLSGVISNFETLKMQAGSLLCFCWTVCCLWPYSYLECGITEKCQMQSQKYKDLMRNGIKGVVWTVAAFFYQIYCNSHL